MQRRIHAIKVVRQPRNVKVWGETQTLKGTQKHSHVELVGDVGTDQIKEAVGAVLFFRKAYGRRNNPQK